MPDYAKKFVSRHSMAFQDTVQLQLEAWLDKQMNQVGSKSKELIKDNDMPLVLQTLVDDVVDNFLPDAKRVLISKTDEMIRYRSPVNRYLLDHTGKLGCLILVDRLNLDVVYT